MKFWLLLVTSFIYQESPEEWENVINGLRKENAELRDQVRDLETFVVSVGSHSSIGRTYNYTFTSESRARKDYASFLAKKEELKNKL